MRNTRCWIRMSILMTLLTAGGASAEPFDGSYSVLQLLLPGERPTSPTRPGEPAPPRKRERFRVAGYWTDWNFSSFDLIRNPTLTPDPLTPGNVLRVERDVSSSGLVTAEYYLSDRLSIGGFWNPLEMELRQSTRVDVPRKIADVDADFWNVHVTYYPPQKWGKGVSVELGYSIISYDTTYVPEAAAPGSFPGRQSESNTERSPNIWLSKAHLIRTERGAVHAHPVLVYGGVGYYAGSDFGDTVDLLLGASLTLTQHLSLAASVWINDVGGADNRRVTLGLAGRF